VNVLSRLVSDLDILGRYGTAQIWFSRTDFGVYCGMSGFLCAEFEKVISYRWMSRSGEHGFGMKLFKVKVLMIWLLLG